MKFILTPELGRLAKWLRILGFDATYETKANFSRLIIQALRDNRVILTRNSHLINKAGVVKTMRVECVGVSQQLKQILNALDLKIDSARMFSRCTICNVELNEIDKQQAEGKVPGYVFQTQDRFFSCSSCQRIYWSGTHWGNVRRCLEEIECNA